MDSRNFRVDWRLSALLGGLGLLGVVLILVANSGGIGMNADSTSYLLSAQNLLDGKGLDGFAIYGPIEDLTEPLVHWPPMFPVALSGLGLLGLDPATGARLLNAVLFGINIALAGWLTFRLSGARWAAIVAALLVLGAPQVLVLHAMAWSEPLFLALALTTLSLLARYLAGGPLWQLVLAGLTVGAACLTRYVGLTLIVTGGVGLLFRPARKLIGRLWEAALFGGLGGLMVGAWMLRNQLLTGSTSGRTLVFHPPALAALKRGLFTVLTWVAPRDAVFVIWPEMLIGLGVGALILLGLAWRTRRHWRAWLARLSTRPEWPLVLMLIGFALFYMLFTLVSITFFDAYTPLDARILAPVYVVVVITAVGMLGRGLAGSALGARTRLIVAGLLVVLVGSYGLRGLDWVARNHATGENLGVAAQPWRESTLMDLVDALPPGTPLATNRQDAVYALSQRLTYRLPRRMNPTTTLSNPAYNDELRSLGNLLAEGSGAVVYFQPETLTYMPSPADLSAHWNICRVERATDGFIYYLCPSAGS